MKNKMYKLSIAVIITLANLLISASIFAQAPQRMSYQAVIRDANNNLVTSHAVGMRVSILRGSATGTTSFSEIYYPDPQTNANGLVTIEIGSGMVLTGSLDTINWAKGPYYISIETDPTGATSYTVKGTSQLLSVPYALNAKTAESISGTITETDPIYAASQAANIKAIDITHLSNLSGVNTGDQDLSAYATKTALADSITNVENKKVDKVTGKDLLSNGTMVGQMLYWNGTAWINVDPGSAGQVLVTVNGIPTWGVAQTAGTNEVQNPKTGRIWMDRNLGATEVATSATDANAYGYLYQWGRGTDGNQIRTSSTTSTLSTSDTPGNANFISIYGDWRSPANDNLWQGVNGINNPCPAGFRLPTYAELVSESSTWSSSDAAGAYASVLKLSLGGYRNGGSALLVNVGSGAAYWTSTISGTYAKCLWYTTNGIYPSDSDNYRASGCSVRCIKN